MTRHQLLKTIIAIRLLARGEWTGAGWLLSIRQKQRGRIRIVPEWMTEGILDAFAKAISFNRIICEPTSKIGDTLTIRRPVRFRGVS